MTTILSTLFLKGGIINFSDASGSVTKVTFDGIFRSTELISKSWPVAILIVLIPVLSGITIFLFKNRRLQLLMVKVTMILILAFIALLTIYSYSVISKFDSQITFGIKMFIPVIQLVLSFLAYRGIKKDDDLVKSYDRLR